MRDRIFYAICFGFILGVFLRSFFFLNFYFVILLGILAFALFLFFTFISKNKWGIITSVFIFTICLGIFRFHVVDVPLPSIFSTKGGPASGWESNKIELSGIIIDEPSIKENNQQLIVEVKNIEGLKKEKIYILFSFSLDEDLKYGDEINFVGKLEKPENFITDQGKEFDYVNYLRKDGIFYVMGYPKIEIVSSGNGNFIKKILFSFKEKFLGNINLAIQNPESLLMGGLILGEKSSFDQALRASFVNTGTIHIVALSGYNVTIVAEWIMKLFAFLPYNFGFGAGILGILFFIIMTGAQSTAIRAGIMAILVLIARATGRNYDVARALILAGFGMILLNPFLLVYDVSFQLSFIATMAVIFLAPRLEKYFLWVTKKFGLRDVVTVTFSAYVFVLPFILYKMGNLSLVALPANILILPLIPITMVFGFLTIFAGLFSYIFAVPFGYISYIFLHYELIVVNFFSNLPFSAFSIPDFPFFLMLIIYAYFIYRLFGRNIKAFFEEVF